MPGDFALTSNFFASSDSLTAAFETASVGSEETAAIIGFLKSGEGEGDVSLPVLLESYREAVLFHRTSEIQSLGRAIADILRKDKMALDKIFLRLPSESRRTQGELLRRTTVRFGNLDHLVDAILKKPVEPRAGVVIRPPVRVPFIKASSAGPLGMDPADLDLFAGDADKRELAEQLFAQLHQNCETYLQRIRLLDAYDIRGLESLRQNLAENMRGFKTLIEKVASDAPGLYSAKLGKELTDIGLLNAEKLLKWMNKSIQEGHMMRAELPDLRDLTFTFFDQRVVVNPYRYALLQAFHSWLRGVSENLGITIKWNQEDLILEGSEELLNQFSNSNVKMYLHLLGLPLTVHKGAPSEPYKMTIGPFPLEQEALVPVEKPVANADGDFNLSMLTPEQVKVCTPEEQLHIAQQITKTLLALAVTCEKDLKALAPGDYEGLEKIFKAFESETIRLQNLFPKNPETRLAESGWALISSCSQLINGMRIGMQQVLNVDPALRLVQSWESVLGAIPFSSEKDEITVAGRKLYVFRHQRELANRYVRSLADAGWNLQWRDNPKRLVLTLPEGVELKPIPGAEAILEMLGWELSEPFTIYFPESVFHVSAEADFQTATTKNKKGSLHALAWVSIQALSGDAAYLETFRKIAAKTSTAGQQAKALLPLWDRLQTLVAAEDFSTAVRLEISILRDYEAGLIRALQSGEAIDVVVKRLQDFVPLFGKITDMVPLKRGNRMDNTTARLAHDLVHRPLLSYNTFVNGYMTHSRSLTRQYLSLLTITKNPSELASLVQTALRDNFFGLVGVGMILEIDVPDGIALSDPPERKILEDVLRKLISNAFVYSDLNNKLEIKLTIRYAPETRTLTIADNGLGIKDVAAVWKGAREHPEIKGKPAGEKSMGLGLVKERIQSIGGSIDLQSTVGTGTTFTITLP